ncbi:MAG: hypothetical protein GY714_20360 [Desulfobacterales bacterium]|nr:hypothetical protein [Desulfobacterales bacterium]
MAKRLIDWNLKGSSLVMGKYIDADTPATELASFDIGKLFPGFNEMTEVQQFLVVYGIKQKLADTGSATKDAEEKAGLAGEMFQMFLDGKFRVPRANATGAKENKAIAEKVRDTAKAVSYEGLTIKKLMFPDTFTDEDQEKLDEFIGIMNAHAEKQK